MNRILLQAVFDAEAMHVFHHMPESRLRELVDGFRRARIAVLGDFFLDKYLETDPALAEVSIETGKTAHQVVEIRCSPGAAGTVCCNLAALGVGSLHAIGFTGDDGESFDLRKGLERLGCSTDHLHVAAERKTPTYLKPRDVSLPGLEGEHNRYDTKNRSKTPVEIEDAILSSLDAMLPRIDALIVLDQVEEADCGAVTSRVRQAIGRRAEAFKNVVFWADSRLRIREFCGVTIKPNQFEAIGRENPPPGEVVDIEELAKAVQSLAEENKVVVCATRGADGMIVSHPEPTLVFGVRVDGPIDPTGAGDSATAGAVLALCAGATFPEAALVGNLVASVTVTRLATTGTASPEELFERLRRWWMQ